MPENNLPEVDQIAVRRFLDSTIKLREKNLLPTLPLQVREEEAAKQLKEIDSTRGKLQLTLEILNLIALAEKPSLRHEMRSLLSVSSSPDVPLGAATVQLSGQLAELESSLAVDHIHALRQLLRPVSQSSSCFPSLKRSIPTYLTKDEKVAALKFVLSRAEEKRALGDRSTATAIPSLFEDITGVPFERAKSEVWRVRSGSDSREQVAELLELGGWASSISEIFSTYVRHEMEKEKGKYFNPEVPQEPWVPDGLMMVAGVGGVLLEPLWNFLKAAKFPGNRIVSWRLSLGKGHYSDAAVISLLGDITKLPKKPAISAESFSAFEKTWSAWRLQLNLADDSPVSVAVQAFVGDIKRRMVPEISHAVGLESPLTHTLKGRVPVGDISTSEAVRGRVPIKVAHIDEMLEIVAGMRSETRDVEGLNFLLGKINQIRNSSARITRLLQLFDLTKESAAGDFSDNLLNLVFNTISYTHRNETKIWNGSLKYVGEIGRRMKRNSELQDRVVAAVSSLTTRRDLSLIRWNQDEINGIVEALRGHRDASTMANELRKSIRQPGITVPNP